MRTVTQALELYESTWGIYTRQNLGLTLPTRMLDKGSRTYRRMLARTRPCLTSCATGQAGARYQTKSERYTRIHILQDHRDPPSAHRAMGQHDPENEVKGDEARRRLERIGEESGGSSSRGSRRSDLHCPRISAGRMTELGLITSGRDLGERFALPFQHASASALSSPPEAPVSVRFCEDHRPVLGL